MADQLAIWNVALAHLGARRLASLTEPREPARVLADEWDAAVRGCLELAPWSFATRTQQVFSGGGGGAGPFPNRLPKPDDWLRTANLASDGALTQPLDGYLEEGANWYAAPTSIFARFVSTGAAYGYNVAGWPQQFADFVALALAARACRRLTGAADMLGDLVKLREAAKQDALAYEDQVAARQYPAPTGAGETRLQIYNSALAYLGRSRTHSLTATTDTVRELNDQWRSAVRWCLQQAPWHFATTTVGLAPAAGVTPRHGFQNAFAVPADWIVTANVAVDIELQQPMESYVEEGRYWFANSATLGVRYVSGDSTLGFDPSRWPEAFADLVALRLAEVSAGRLAADPKGALQEITQAREAAVAAARSIEAETVSRVLPIDPAILIRVAVCNDALSRLGVPRIFSLTEATETVRILISQWRPAVRWCLQKAPWSFATKTVGLPPAVGVSPRHGFSNAFAKPSDWVVTANVAADIELQQPLEAYVEEGGYWFANVPALGVRYVSADATVGLDTSDWTPAFADFVALRLAEICASRLTPDAKALLPMIAQEREAAEATARAIEADTVSRALPSDPALVTRLSVCNDALSHVGLPRLYSLTEASERVRVLNQHFGEAARWALAQAPWFFAAKVVGLPPVGGINPSIYAYAFAKPADWVMTLDIASDWQFTYALYDYVDESGVWYADTKTLGVRYVSKHTDFGLNLTLWPEGFRELVAYRLAEMIAGPLGAGERSGQIIEGRDAARAAAVDMESTRAARSFGSNDQKQSRLDVYNTALGHLGRPRMAFMSETHPVSRTLHSHYTSAVRWCLRQGRWAFAARVVTLAPTGDAPPAPYSAGFEKPVDWISTLDVALDEQVTQPVPAFADEAGRWYADAPQLVVRYVSQDPAYGLNTALWSAAFLDFVALRLAELSAGQLGADGLLGALTEKRGAAQQSAQVVEDADAARRYPGDPTLQAQIAVFNDALGYLGRPRMAALTDAGPVMRALIEAWPHAVRWALEQGPWTFAIRAIAIGPFGDTVPTFGYGNAFKKPDDWLQTVLVSEWDDFRAGSTTYADETGWWFSDAPGLFVRYVSLGPNYGMNLGRWPASFVDLVALRIAERVAPQIGAGALVGGLVSLRGEAMKRQRATDAQNTPPVFPPQGSWVAARRGGNAAGRRWGAGPGGPSIPFTGDTTLSGDSDLPINNDFVPRISG